MQVTNPAICQQSFLFFMVLKGYKGSKGGSHLVWQAPIFKTHSQTIYTMTSEVFSLQAAKEKQDSIAIEKIRVLNSLINSSIPIDTTENVALFQSREGTVYVCAFTESERNVFKKKIMELVKSL